MVVTIDGTDWLYGERAVRRHVVNLVQLVGTFGEGIEYRIFLNRFRKNGREVPPPRPGVQVRAFPCPRRIFGLLNERWGILPVNRLSGRTDLFHAAGSNLMRCRAGQYLYTVGGLAPFALADLLPPDYVARTQAAFLAALPRITHFLAVSETTRRELMERFGLPPERVTAIPLGVDREFRPLDPAESAEFLRQRFPIRRPYALYVGGIQRNKNIARLIEAFALAARGPLKGWQLVLVGPQVWGDRETDGAIEAGQREGSVVLTGSQTGEALVRLYSAAELFVFPSLYEGWTSPPLEAMACGVPVVASRASSLPETVGDAAELVDPLDLEGMARGMARVVEDPARRSELRERGLVRAAQFTWERSISATVDLYRRLCLGDRIAG